MTYKQELEAKYAAIRSRMYGNKPPVVRMALLAAQEAQEKDLGCLLAPVAVGGIAGPTGLSAPPTEAPKRRGPIPMAEAAGRYIEVLREVARRHGIDPELIQSGGREREIVAARHELWWLVKTKLGYSYPRLARLARRDHSSIYHGVQMHAAKVLDALTANLQVA